MTEITRLIFPTDLSESSMAVFPYAVRLSRLLSSELDVLNVDGGSAGEEERRHGLEELVSIAGRRGVIARPVVRPGARVVDGLLEHSSERGDLYVLATSGRRPHPGRRLSGLVRELVERSSVPVMTVHPRMALRAAVPNRIMVPIDPVDPRHEGVRYAIQLARSERSQLHLVAVTSEADAGGATGTEQSGAALGARQALERLLQKLGAHDRVRTHITDGSIIQELLRWCDDERADLIVLSRKGEPSSTSDNAPVAHALLQRADVPVLTVKI